MNGAEFSVMSGGEPATLTADGAGFEVTSDAGRRGSAWGSVRKVSRRDERSVVLTFAHDRPLQVAFAAHAEREEFLGIAEGGIAVAPPVEARTVANAPGDGVPLLTVSFVPGREVVAVAGLVTAQSVMSRDLFSDAGSDLKSTIGGSLKGMERAVAAAVASARRDLAAGAMSLGCDSVIGVTISIAGVGDKAQAVLLSGTAVRTVEVAAERSD